MSKPGGHPARPVHLSSLHDGDTYLVRKLDLEGKLAYVERMETDYYTQAILESHVRIQAERDSHPVGAGPEAVQGLGGSEEFGPAGFALEADDSRARFSFGDLEVSWKTVAFKKIKFETRENLGMGPVDLPAQTLPTTGFWLVLSPEIERLAKSHGLRPAEGMVGIRNLMIQALPLVAMCDPRDIGGGFAITSPATHIRRTPEWVGVRPWRSGRARCPVGATPRSARKSGGTIAPSGG